MDKVVVSRPPNRLPYIQTKVGQSIGVNTLNTIITNRMETLLIEESGG